MKKRLRISSYVLITRVTALEALHRYTKIVTAAASTKLHLIFQQTGMGLANPVLSSSVLVR
jgi:hypothetical protein